MDKFVVYEKPWFFLKVDDARLHYIDRNFEMWRRQTHIWDLEKSEGPMTFRDYIENEANRDFRNYVVDKFMDEMYSRRFD